MHTYAPTQACSMAVITLAGVAADKRPGWCRRNSLSTASARPLTQGPMAPETVDPRNENSMTPCAGNRGPADREKYMPGLRPLRAGQCVGASGSQYKEQATQHAAVRGTHRPRRPIWSAGRAARTRNSTRSEMPKVRERTPAKLVNVVSVCTAMLAAGGYGKRSWDCLTRERGLHTNL